MQFLSKLMKISKITFSSYKQLQMYTNAQNKINRIIEIINALVVLFSKSIIKNYLFFSSSFIFNFYLLIGTIQDRIWIFCLCSKVLKFEMEYCNHRLVGLFVDKIYFLMVHNRYTEILWYCRLSFFLPYFLLI